VVKGRTIDNRSRHGHQRSGPLGYVAPRWGDVSSQERKQHLLDVIFIGGHIVDRNSAPVLPVEPTIYDERKPQLRSVQSAEMKQGTCVEQIATGGACEQGGEKG
jgi:hypothetical protein